MPFGPPTQPEPITNYNVRTSANIFLAATYLAEDEPDASDRVPDANSWASARVGNFLYLAPVKPFTCLSHSAQVEKTPTLRPLATA